MSTAEQHNSVDSVEAATLYVVATPIGHRNDISARAISVLRSVDCIYAEDTRHSLPLLRYHGIATRVVALHEHNESAMLETLLHALQQGASLALIADAGTPLISDPGYRLVRQCLKVGVRVSPVPGASALTAALSVAGLPTDRFEFVGFPPARQGARQNFFRTLAATPHTLVLYESPHRILDSLEDLAQVFGAEREMTLARELTKRFETLLHGSIGAVLERLRQDSDQQRGEFVLLIGGAPQGAGEGALDAARQIELDTLLQALLPHLPIKTAARIAADLQGVPKRDVYRRALELQQAANR